MTPSTQPIKETLRDGSRVTIRPISSKDVELERHFIEDLSPQSRRFRFLCSMNTPSDALLRQLTQIDGEHDAALIALDEQPAGSKEVGVARFSATADGRAEIAVAVSDEWQHRGLGTILLSRLINVARSRGIKTLYSVDSAANEPMRELAAYLGFARTTDPEDATQVIHTLKLN
jgi:N-acetylglutamate synthase-like GNAT family acetyltransferase